MIASGGGKAGGNPLSFDAMRTQSVVSIVLLLLALLLAGCAHNSTPLEPYDPYEQTNRKVFAFNQELDRYVLEPVATGYAKITPNFFRRGVQNFFANAAYPSVIINDFLQGKGMQGLQDTGRFLINTTVGLFGIWDPASYLGLPAHDEDFGQTLAVWGANSGPYLELPLFGPRYTRETVDLPLGAFTNVLGYVFSWNVTIPLAALYVVNTRAQLDAAVKIREQAALDPYLFTRAAYMQLRENLIHDGKPPVEDLYDESLFEDDDALPAD